MYKGEYVHSIFFLIHYYTGASAKLWKCRGTSETWSQIFWLFKADTIKVCHGNCLCKTWTRSDSRKKIKLITYFEVSLGYIYLTQLLKANITLSTVEIIRKGICYPCRSFVKDLLFSMLTGPFLIQTFNHLQCFLSPLVISFSWYTMAKYSIKLHKEIDMKVIKKYKCSTSNMAV